MRTTATRTKTTARIDPSIAFLCFEGCQGVFGGCEYISYHVGTIHEQHAWIVLEPPSIATSMTQPPREHPIRAAPPPHDADHRAAIPINARQITPHWTPLRRNSRPGPAARAHGAAAARLRRSACAASCGGALPAPTSRAIDSNRRLSIAKVLNPQATACERLHHPPLCAAARLRS